MKYLRPLFLIVFACCNFYAKADPPDNYSIHGQLKNWEGKYIYFTCKGLGDSRVWDSAIVKNNSFSFSGNLEEPSNGFITTLKYNRVKNLNDKNITERLFISPSAISISLKLNEFHKAIIKGAVYQTEYENLEKDKKEFYNEIGKINDKIIILNEEYLKKRKLPNQEQALISLENKMDSLELLKEPLFEKCVEIDKSFFKKNPSSYVTSYLLSNYYTSFALPELETYYNNMWAVTKKWEYGIKLKEAILRLQKGSPGYMASNFIAKDLKNASLSLSQYKGKYILLDFWATWCKPCRAGNPELIALYNKYQNKGIEFIGIAADVGNENNWKLAVEKDNIDSWPQILDIEIGVQYAVHTIPLQILIDPNGRIINRFGSSGEPNENIRKTLEKLFGE